MNFKKRICLGIILLALIFLAIPPICPTYAQATVRTMTIVPPNIQYTLDPGSYKEGILKVINDSEEALTFAIATRDYIVIDTQGTPNLLPPNTLNANYSAASWIGVSPNSFTVEPHTKQVLNYYLQVPKDARPGGHYAAITYTPAASSGVQSSGASVQTEVGTLFYITVNGPIKEQSQIKKFTANSFQEYGPVRLFTQITNMGDLHVKPLGTIIVYDILGRTVDSQSLTQFNIFPMSLRDYENTVGSKIMLGRFTVHLLAGYGKNNNLPLAATLTFWVFPWKIALLIALVLTTIILGIKLWMKKSQIQNNANQNANPHE